MASWEDKPEFWCRFAVGWGKWWIEFGYDRRTRGGKKYLYVDEGTGSYVGGTSYIIKARKKKALKFVVPTPIKSTPGIVGIGPGLVKRQGITGQETIVRKQVTHPGIRPRYFSKSLRDLLKQRTRPGGFRSVTDAAVKRGFNKVMKAGISK